MKYDKQTIIVMVVCMALIMLWYPAMRQLGLAKEPPPEEKPGEFPNITKNADNAQKQPAPADQDGKTEKTTPGQQTPSQAKAPDKTPVSPTEQPALPAEGDLKAVDSISLENDCLEVEVNPNTGTVDAIKLKKFLTASRESNVVLFKYTPKTSLGLSSKKAWELRRVHVDEQTANSAKITRDFTMGGKPFSVVQSWTLQDEYQLNYSVQLVTSDSTPIVFDEFKVSVGKMPNLRELTGDQTRRDTHCIGAMLTEGKKYKTVYTDDDLEDFKNDTIENSVDWACVNNKFFTAILIPDKPFDKGTVNAEEQLESRWLGKGDADKFWELETSGMFREFTISQESPAAFDFTYYAGPKEIFRLEALGADTPQVLQLTYVPFNYVYGIEWISRLLLKGLSYLKNYVGSYGISIIILTIIVKTLFWPLTQRANNSMRKMQKLQPMIKEIKDKYEKNPQKMNQEVMALYRKHNVNPLGGCLPLLLQMPVFIALFSALGGAVELRQTPFLWASDLSLPDSVGPALIFGQHIHPLILIWAGLMLLQQKITPKAGDPMQQKMMTFMPLFMLFLLYSMPAGLTLYWTVNQIISLIQLLLNQHKAKKEEALEAASAA